MATTMIASALEITMSKAMIYASRSEIMPIIHNELGRLGFLLISGHCLRMQPGVMGLYQAQAPNSLPSTAPSHHT